MDPSIIVLRPHLRDLGGLMVRRLLPAHPTRSVGPFVFFDHFGPVTFAPGQGFDVRPHPHIGLATVTYLFEGALMHRDSLGTVQRIEPGDVNWMVAGRGIVHSERSDARERAAGSPMHGLQTWVALPKAQEESAPAFTHVGRERLPAFARDGVTGVVVAGRAFGYAAPVSTLSETLYVALALSAGARLEVPPEHEERAVYAIEGEIAIDGAPLALHHLCVLPPGRAVTVSASIASRAMLVGGAALDGERTIWWNFVSSSRERIESAKEDWAAQRFGHVPGETEFIPLPDTAATRAPAPEPGAGSVP
jgi:redox-sensitive bicupin YhaK (pirin superfamily)